MKKIVLDVMVEIIEILKAEKNRPFSIKVKELLESLGYEEVMAIQTIMYIGRNCDDDEIVSCSASQLFQRCRETLTENSKEYEINQIIEKRDLAKYLERGCSALGFVVGSKK